MIVPYKRPVSRAIPAAATIVFRQDLMIVMADSAAEALFGRPATDLIGAPVGCVLQQKSDLALYRSIVRNGSAPEEGRRAVATLDLVGEHETGRRFPLRATLTEGVFLGHRIFMAEIVPRGRRKRDPRMRVHAI